MNIHKSNTRKYQNSRKTSINKNLKIHTYKTNTKQTQTKNSLLNQPNLLHKILSQKSKIQQK